MPTIAITLIGHDEAHLLPTALESVRWADEIVYVDCESGDDSLAVARRYTDKVFSRPNTSNLNINKTYGIEQTTQSFAPDGRSRYTPVSAGPDGGEGLRGLRGRKLPLFQLRGRDFPGAG